MGYIRVHRDSGFAVTFFIAVTAVYLCVAIVPIPRGLALWVQMLLYVYFPVAAAVMAWVTVNGASADDRRAWRLLAPAMTLMALAALVWAAAHLFVPAAQQFRALLLGETAHLFGYLLLGAFAIVILVDRFRAIRTRGLQRWRYAVDIVFILAIAVFAIAIFVVEPLTAIARERMTAELWVYLAYGLADLLVLACMLMTLATATRQARGGWELMIAAGASLVAVANVSYGTLVAKAAYRPTDLTSSVLDLLWMGGYLLFAMAAGRFKAAGHEVGPLKERGSELVWAAVVPTGLVALMTPVFVWALPPRGSAAWWLWTGGASAMAALMAVRTVLLVLSGRELELESYTDPLTGVRNRRQFSELLTVEVARSKRSERPMTVALLDLDHFREVNEEHGHLAGDECLRSMADEIRGAVRVIDAVCRVGGDEFGIVLPDADSAEALRVCARMRRVIGAKRREDPLCTTLSIGIATYPEHGCGPDDLVHAADIALYEAKARGRDRAIAFEPGMKDGHWLLDEDLA